METLSPLQEDTDLEWVVTWFEEFVILDTAGSSGKKEMYKNMCALK